jgi:Protein of unknown function (DUF2924)
MKQHANIALQVAQLPQLPMEELWALWDAHFDARPNHHHRTWLESRLAYRLQERAYGALKPTVRRKLQQIGETGLLPKGLQRDSDQLLPGTVLTRTFDDVEHRVTVRGLRDFEYQGRRFTSLSAVARSIAGCPWSGPAFFGLKSGKKQEAA